MRRWISLAVLLTVTVVPAAVMAQSRDRVSGSGVGAINRQAYHFATGDSVTSDQGFTDMPGLGRQVCAGGIVVATLTVNLGGGLVDLQVLDRAPGGPQVMHPTSVHANPTTGTTGFTFSFVIQVGAPHLHTFNPQWRSTTGGPVTLHGGALILQFESKQGAC